MISRKVNEASAFFDRNSLVFCCHNDLKKEVMHHESRYIASPPLRLYRKVQVCQLIGDINDLRRKLTSFALNTENVSLIRQLHQSENNRTRSFAPCAFRRFDRSG